MTLEFDLRSAKGVRRLAKLWDVRIHFAHWNGVGVDNQNHRSVVVFVVVLSLFGMMQSFHRKVPVKTNELSQTPKKWFS